MAVYLIEEIVNEDFILSELLEKFHYGFRTSFSWSSKMSAIDYFSVWYPPLIKYLKKNNIDCNDLIIVHDKAQKLNPTFYDDASEEFRQLDNEYFWELAKIIKILDTNKEN